MILDILKRREKELERKIDTIILTREVKAFKFIKERKIDDEWNEYTLDEIAQFLGISRDRVRQIESNAIKKLKHPRVGRFLKEYSSDNGANFYSNVDTTGKIEIDFEQFTTYGSGVSVDYFHDLYKGLNDEDEMIKGLIE